MRGQPGKSKALELLEDALKDTQAMQREIERLKTESDTEDRRKKIEVMRRSITYAKDKQRQARALGAEKRSKKVSKKKKKTMFELFLQGTRSAGVLYSQYCRKSDGICDAESLMDAQDADEGLRMLLMAAKQNGMQPLRSAQSSLSASMYWAKFNRPIFKATVGLCASLAITECPGKVEDIQLPFPSFLLIPANGNLFEDDRYGDVQALLVSMQRSNNVKGRSLVIDIVGDKDQILSWMELTPGMDCEEMVQGTSREVGDYRALYRLVINLVEYMNATKETKHTREEKPKKGVMRGFTVRYVGGDIKINPALRAAAREFILTGKGKSLKTRHMRRGHFTNQPHGPKHSLRKRIFRAPVWVGPDIGETVERGYSVE